MSDKLRLFGLGLVTSAGAGILGMTAMMNSAFAYGDAAVGDAARLAAPVVTQVMGGSGLPIPPPQYVGGAFYEYINQYIPNAVPVGLNTPENLYPLFPPTGFAGAPEAPSLINQLPFDSSVAQGVTILNNELVANGLNTAGAAPQGVFGYSQSATIATLEMNQLIANGTPSSAVDFSLIGDPNLPNGGLLARFPGLSLSALGLTFSGPTPSDAFDTTINTIQYDGFADFPKYPINLLSDVNAFLGIETLHGHYLDPEIAGLHRTLLDGSVGTPDAGNSLTNYYMIDTTGTSINPTGLPILNPIYNLPVIGHPLAALLQPDLTYLVNLGYGDGSLGYSLPANGDGAFGLFPNVNPLTFLQTLGGDTVKGVQDFFGSITGGGLSLSALSDPFQSLLNGGNPLADLTSMAAAAASPTELITNAANAISSAGSTAYGALLPTTDILNSLVTSVPAYDLSLFVDGLQSIPTAGLEGLVNAFGLPVAADVGIGTLAAGFELTILEGTVTNIMTELGGLIP